MALFSRNVSQRRGFVRSGERAARLQIAQRPPRRHLRQAGDPRTHAWHRRRSFDDEHVEWQRRVWSWSELAASARKIERAVGLMDEHRPPVGADQPLHGRACRAWRGVSVTFPALCLFCIWSVEPFLSNCTPLAEAEERPAQQKRHPDDVASSVSFAGSGPTCSRHESSADHPSRERRDRRLERARHWKRIGLWRAARRTRPARARR